MALQIENKELIDFTEDIEKAIVALPVKRKKKALDVVKAASEMVEKGEAKKIRINSSLNNVDVEFTYTPTTDWTGFNVKDIVDKMCQFSDALSGVPLYDYQRGLQKRIFESVLLNDGEEITALFARQSGKSECVAQTANTLMVFLPILAGIFPQQLSRFKRGVRIGLFAPINEQAFTTHQRMDMRLSSEEADTILSDPDIQASKGYNNGVLQVYGPEIQFPSGKMGASYYSYCRVQSTAKQAKIESKTYDIMLIDEAQDVDTLKMEKSIHPMGASTNATIIKIGTATNKAGNFYYSTMRNKRKHAQHGVQNHFEYDWRIVQKYNALYKAFMQKERERIGEDSDAFRMSYNLEWLLEKGMALTLQMFEEYMKDSSKLEYTPNENFQYVGGLDLAKENDSTILTVAKIEGAVMVSDEEGDQTEKYIKKVVNWLEMTGDNWEVQFATIVEFVRNYKLSVLTVDSTGVGDPIFDRLERVLSDTDCVLVPVIFNLKSKHEMATIFYSEMRGHRIKIPSHPDAKRTRRFKNFIEQFTSCEKVYKGSYVQLKHADEKDARDDYVDSLLLLCYGVEQQILPKATSSGNFLFHPEMDGKMTERSKRYNAAMRQRRERSGATWQKR